MLSAYIFLSIIFDWGIPYILGAILGALPAFLRLYHLSNKVYNPNDWSTSIPASVAIWYIVLIIAGGAIGVFTASYFVYGNPLPWQ